MTGHPAPGPGRRHSDVLVIGAGSAGSVLAERLSADPGCRVTVVESGPGPSHPGVRALTGDGLSLPVGESSPLAAWFEATLTEEPARSVRLVRGATVGGSGAVNGGYFCRGVPDDYAEWNLPGWSPDEVNAHFRAIETDLDFRGPEHGDSGPIRVRRSVEFSVGTAEFLAGCERAGLPWLADLNAPTAPRLQTGVGAVPLNIVEGRRVGPGAAFLAPALDRPNLTVLTGMRAHRIRFTRGWAQAVDIDGQHGAMRLTADRIVLCAGAIGTAQLLMLSGIGDAESLRAQGIPVVQSLPVGQRCADHPEWVIPTVWPSAERRPVLEVVASLADDLEIRPYTQGFGAMLGDTGRGQPDWTHLGVALMKPRSRARVTLMSANLAVPVRIEHRYDSEPHDSARLRHGAEFLREIFGPATFLSDAAWSTSQHLCGSAPMGADDDPNAVLDERCRVRGVSGLWVIDGSAFPTIPSRGPHASTVMLAHRAAEFVTSGR